MARDSATCVGTWQASLTAQRRYHTPIQVGFSNSLTSIGEEVMSQFPGLGINTSRLDGTDTLPFSDSFSDDQIDGFRKSRACFVNGHIKPANGIWGKALICAWYPGLFALPSDTSHSQPHQFI